jgi:hypothetical protein
VAAAGSALLDGGRLDAPDLAARERGADAARHDGRPDVHRPEDGPAATDQSPLKDLAITDKRPLPDQARPPDQAGPDQTVPGDPTPWWSAAHSQRLRIRLTNPSAVARLDQPVFVSGASLLAVVTGEAPRESSLRLVRWTGLVNQPVTVALHDWDDQGGLGDSDGELDASDEILFLAAVPAGGSADYYLYYATQDLAPAVTPTVSLSPGGTGFSRVKVDGTSQAASYLRQIDGAPLYDLMLTDSIPYWNHTSYFTYESSALGPRLNNLKLPDGTSVFATVDHGTGQPPGPLVHTVRLGPIRKHGAFNILSSDNPYFQARLVAAVSHSQVRAYSRALAAVVVIDAEMYCDESNSCQPALDYGDVRLVGYAFDRGAHNEVLMRWRVEARMDGKHSIQPGGSASYTEEYALAAYLLEGYAQAQFSALIDIDTVRVRDGSGGLASAVFDSTAAESRLCRDAPRWLLMSDTDAPQGGTVSLLPEAAPVVNGAAASWRGCWFNDAGALEPNGYQSEWHLTSNAFQTWGSGPTDSASYSYWVHAYPPGASDTALADDAAVWVGTPLVVSVACQARASVP